MTFFCRSAISLSTLLIAGGLAAQDSKPGSRLRYAFEKGAKGHFVMATAVDMDINKGAQKMNMNMSLFVTYEVTDVVDGKGHVTNTLDRMKMTGNNPMMGKIDFDTDNEDSVPAMFDRYLDLVGQEISTVVDNRGHVEVEQPTGANAAAMQSTFNDKTFSQMIPVLPETPVDVGGTWTTTMEMPGGQMGPMKMGVLNKLIAVDDETFTVEGTLEVDLSGMPDGAVKPNFTKATSMTVMDRKSAIPHRQSVEMVMNASGDQGGMAMGMDMTMKMTVGRTEAPQKSAEPSKPTSRKSDK